MQEKVMFVTVGAGLAGEHIKVTLSSQVSEPLLFNHLPDSGSDRRSVSCPESRVLLLVKTTTLPLLSSSKPARNPIVLQAPYHSTYSLRRRGQGEEEVEEKLGGELRGSSVPDVPVSLGEDCVLNSASLCVVVLRAPRAQGPLQGLLLSPNLKPCAAFGRPVPLCSRLRVARRGREGGTDSQ
ncbi:hypothetical protein GOODEAATRI_016604, partial [Goodea atripinnis]